MAYTLPNTGIIRPWDHSKNRYIHRRVKLTVSGSGKGGGSTGTASDDTYIPCPGRLVAVSYGGENTTESRTVGAALTGGTLLIKAETTAGATVYTDATLNSVTTTPPRAVGTTSLDEGRAATAATDGFSGGFPVRAGVFCSISGGTDTEVLVLDLYFRLCTWVKLELVAQSGADGTGAVTRTIPLGNAGVLAAVALDFQNMPSTTDVVIKAENTNGNILFTSTSSLTDLAPTLIGGPAYDEAAGAAAATDGTECGMAFQGGLFFDVAEADIFTGGNEKIVVECWIDD